MRLVTSSQCVIIQGKSPTARMGTGADLPVLTSSACTEPACSKTSAPPPAPSDLTSKSVKRVTCVSCFVPGANAHTLATPSRSERKYTVSPSHTGSMSFEPVQGGDTSAWLVRSTIQIGRFCPPR